MLIIREIRLPFNKASEDDYKQSAFEEACKIISCKNNDIKDIYVHRLSVDARHRKVSLVYSVAVELFDNKLESKISLNNKNNNVFVYKDESLGKIKRLTKKPENPVVVCGMGPAGLFAALELAKAGLEPLLIEQGPDIEQRRKAVKNFEKTGELNIKANIQFGEGGAGTFSDGKLISRIGCSYKNVVLKQLVKAGAPEEILFMAKPHIGTDLLQNVFKNLRQEYISLGGKVMFETKLIGLEMFAGKLSAIKTNNGTIKCSELVLAVGHSARDTYSILPKSGLVLQGKPFSVGFRIEHLQKDIDKSLYHDAAGSSVLPAGEYQLSANIPGNANGVFGVYTFCMCPGGQVVAAASEEGGVVTNGMSLNARNSKNANSAVVVGIDRFTGSAFEGMEFQRSLEEKAFKSAVLAGNYAAPAETVGSFLKDKGELNIANVEPSYPRGVKAEKLSGLLPSELSSALKSGLQIFGTKIEAFSHKDAILTGLETRTSTPVRIVRHKNFQSEGCENIWPCGEGAGYAGGITSAAIDGIEVGRAILEKYSV